MWIFALVALFVAAGSVAPLHAQDGFCLRGRPAPDCAWVGIVEAAVQYRAVGSNPVTPDPERWDVTWQVGALRNSPAGTAAWGGSFLIGTGEYRPRLALLARHRRWWDGGWTLDLGAGPMTQSTSVEEWGVGFVGDVGMGYRDLAGAFGRLEVLPRAEGGAAAAGSVGVKLGSWPALAGTGATGLIVLVWLLTADFQ